MGKMDIKPSMANPPHPGGIVQDMLDDLGLSITEAANQLGVTRAALSRVINGKTAISPEMALRLSTVFGFAVHMWLGMQADHDAAQIKLRADEIVGGLKRYEGRGMDGGDKSRDETR